MVKHERARQTGALPSRLLQLVAKLDRAKRVEARLHQRSISIQGTRAYR